MPRGRTIGFAASAMADLHDIRIGHVEQGAPEAGDRLLRGIISEVERLATFPESGRIVPEFGVPQLREIIHPPFRIVYRLDDDQIRVIRVWRSERRLDIR